MENTGKAAVLNDSPAINVLLIDDHNLVLELVKTFLSADGGFSVTVASDLSSGLAKIKEASGFDVVLLDVVLPGLTGISDVAKVVSANGDGAVVLFSGSVSANFVEKALKEGARGFIPKTLPLRALTSAIRLVAVGQTFIPGSFSYGPTDAVQPGEGKVTPVESSVLRHLSKGLPNKEIAFLLKMSETTVKMHVRSICRKLGARNRTHAVIMGRADGLL